MKAFQKLSMLLVVLALSFTSCEWDTSPEPEHPTYVTYTVSAWQESFDGPLQLSTDIATWIKDNTIMYDRQINYSTGDVSEFAKTDPEIYTHYDTFKAKFTNHLNKEVRNQLANSTMYGKDVKVQATYFIFANRSYGDGKDFKSEKVVFSYP